MKTILPENEKVLVNRQDVLDIEAEMASLRREVVVMQNAFASERDPWGDFRYLSKDDFVQKLIAETNAQIERLKDELNSLRKMTIKEFKEWKKA
jgi:hypothetical protein